ncbi:MAG: HAD family hydrolase [candidate division Zixibacteria bacterium]|nr:HAD family hydrolase [candidate division Zixibacteria bacterium]
MNKAVFLDRDGVINQIVYHRDIGIVDTPFHPSQFKLLPDVKKALRKINRLGLKTILVSNQPGVAKKHMSLKNFYSIDQKMRKEMSKNKVTLDAVYYCLHHPQGSDKRFKKNCSCRKPKPGLILRASKELKIDPETSYLVGDSLTDIQAGKKAGCTTFLLGNHKCDICRLMEKKNTRPDYIVKDLFEAVKLIEKKEGVK